MQPTLNDRQERFVLEYLKDQNASAAAARAGYTARNMAQQGNELMSHPLVRERVRLGMQDLLAELRASALALMKQRVRAAFFDPAKLVDGWEPRPLDQLDEETLSVLDVRTVMRKSGPVITVKQPDRHRALRALEKAYEKLEQLNERHYAWLERNGMVPSLEEIEAMADEEQKAAAEKTEIPMVLSGSTAVDPPSGAQISEKPMEISGCVDEVALAAARISENAMVLSGGEADVLRKTEIRGQSTFAQTKKRIFEGRPQFPAESGGVKVEKTKGLSGSGVALRPTMFGAATRHPQKLARLA